MNKTIDAVLVVMPFGPLNMPSIGIGLLQAALQRKSISARSFYFTFPFAKLIGERFYSDISDGEPARCDLVGEWIFSGNLFSASDSQVQSYVEEVLHGKSRHHSTSRNGKFYEQRRDGHTKALPPEWIDQVLSAREKSSGFLNSCVDAIATASPRIVGITSMFQQHVASLALAKKLRSVLPEAFIIIGGSNCEGPMGKETAHSFPFLDAVVSGEADEIFPTVAEAVMGGSPIPFRPGLYLQSDKREFKDVMESEDASVSPPILEMDALPYPTYDDYFEQILEYGIDLSEVGEPHIVFETARGCWWGQRHHCTFCGLNGSTMAFRSKSPQRALAELEYLGLRYPGHGVSVSDNILDNAYLDTFVPALRDKQLGLKLFYEVKANLKKENVRLLRDAGIDRIQPGIESFSTSVLKLMRKGVTGIQNVQLLKWCCELGVVPMWGILWGFPGEDPEEYAKMAQLIPSLTHLYPPIGVTPIRLDRFSPNFAQAEALGFTEVAPFPSYSHVYHLSSEAVRNLAYFFSYSYRDRRDVASYTSGVVREVEQWRNNYGQSSLFFVDKGSSLIIFDFRPTAVRHIHKLRDVQRAVYLACDQAVSLDQALGTLKSTTPSITKAELEESLGRLVEWRLMIRGDQKYLSLAVKLGDYQPPLSALIKMRDQIEHQLPASSGEVILPECANVGGDYA